MRQKEVAEIDRESADLTWRQLRIGRVLQLPVTLAVARRTTGWCAPFRYKPGEREGIVFPRAGAVGGFLCALSIQDWQGAP